VRGFGSCLSGFRFRNTRTCVINKKLGHKLVTKTRKGWSHGHMKDLVEHGVLIKGKGGSHAEAFLRCKKGGTRTH